MALNPRIMALPPQETDRDAHIHRFLTSLPRPGSPPDVRTGEAGVRGEAGATMDGSCDPHVRDATAAGSSKDVEVERSQLGHPVKPQPRLKLRHAGLYKRKMRRREKAAIINPKQGLDAPPPQTDGELPDEWWDEFRRQKRGQLKPIERIVHSPSPPSNRPGRIPAAGGKQSGKGKGKAKAKVAGLKGMDLVMNYRSTIPIPASRLTLPPHTTTTTTTKGLFANGRSSDPQLLANLTNKAHSSQSDTRPQVKEKKIINHTSSSEAAGDWRDRWRAKPDNQRDYTRLPPPGFTQSSPWPSQDQSNGSSSRDRSMPANWQGQYMYRGAAIPGQASPAIYHPEYTPLRQSPVDIANANQSSHTHIERPTHTSHFELPLPYRYTTPQPGPSIPPHMYEPIDPTSEMEAIPPELESELQDFWKRDTPSIPKYRHAPTPVSFGQTTYDNPEPRIAEYGAYYPDPYSAQTYSQLVDHRLEPADQNAWPNLYAQPPTVSTHHLDGEHHQRQRQRQVTPLPLSPYIPRPPHEETTPTPVPFQQSSISLSGSYAYRPSLQSVDEREEYGTTTDEWKHLWSTRKPYR